MNDKCAHELMCQNLQLLERFHLSNMLLLVDARTYYSRMQTVHGVSWDSATQYRDDYIKEKMERGATKDSLNRSGFYLSTTTQNQGQTGAPIVHVILWYPC